MTLVYTSGTTGPPKGAMLTNANADFSMDTIVNLRERLPGGKPPNQDDLIVTYLPLCHVAERIFSTWHLVAMRVGAQLRRVDRHDRGEPQRGPADALLRRAADLGEAPRHGAHPRPGRHLVQAQGARLQPRPGPLDREDPRRQRRQPHDRQPPALLRRLRARPARAEDADRPAALPLRRVGRGADRSRGARVLHRHRGAGVRALRDDRELGRGHRQLPRTDEAGHGRRAVPRHRACASIR